DLFQRVRRDEQPDGLLLRGQQLRAVELCARNRGVARSRERRGGPFGTATPRAAAEIKAEIEDGSLADQRVLPSLLARPLSLLEHREHALARGSGGAECAAFDQRLDRLLVDRTPVDARAEIPQVAEWTDGCRAGGI